MKLFIFETRNVLNKCICLVYIFLILLTNYSRYDFLIFQIHHLLIMKAVQSP